jgi:hypothetical protein
MNRTTAVFALALIAITSPAPAYAYLDAGTGSMILQLLLGGLAGLAVVGKLYWNNTKEFVRKIFNGSPAERPK